MGQVYSINAAVLLIKARIMGQIMKLTTTRQCMIAAGLFFVVWTLKRRSRRCSDEKEEEKSPEDEASQVQRKRTKILPNSNKPENLKDRSLADSNSSAPSRAFYEIINTYNERQQHGGIPGANSQSSTSNSNNNVPNSTTSSSTTNYYSSVSGDGHQSYFEDKLLDDETRQPGCTCLLKDTQHDPLCKYAQEGVTELEGVPNNQQSSEAEKDSQNEQSLPLDHEKQFLYDENTSNTPQGGHSVNLQPPAAPAAGNEYHAEMKDSWMQSPQLRITKKPQNTDNMLSRLKLLRIQNSIPSSLQKESKLEQSTQRWNRVMSEHGDSDDINILNSSGVES